MLTNSQESKLDLLIKKTLSSYEVEYNADDWSKMEKVLEVVPKSKPFKASYLLFLLIGVLVIYGSYLLYTKISFEKKSAIINPVILQKDSIVAPKSISTKSIISTKKIVSIDSVSQKNSSYVNQDSIDDFTAMEAEKLNATEDEKKLSKIKASEKTEKQDSLLKEKKLKKELAAKEKLKNKLAAKEKELNKQQNSKDSEEAAFGDMLDTTRGIVREIKEKDQSKKPEVENNKTPVGWNSSLLKDVNPDSIKVRRTRKDSLKRKK